MPKAEAGHQINKEEKSLTLEKKREERRQRQQALKEKRASGAKKGRPMKLGTVKKSD